MGTVTLIPDGSGNLVGTLTSALVEPNPPTGQMAPGNHTVTAVFGGLDTAHFAPPASPTTTLTITVEDARAYYSGALLASTGSINTTSATVTLAATIKDISAITGDPASDAFAGDIRNATVKFVNRDASSAVLCTAAVGLINSADPTVGTATCNVTLTANATAGGSSYTIGIVVGNYYVRNDAYDNQVINVYIPQSNFITGGGYLALQNSAGLYPGQPGTKNNWGFNVKYNKQGTNLQGNINAIIRNNGRVYQIKGNSMTSLVVNYCPVAGEPGYKPSGCIAPVAPCTGTATPACPIAAVFNGKASIQDITDPNNVISIDGNATLQVTMTDYGSPSADTIGITVWNKAGGMWFSSSWSGTKTVEQALGGGNLSVH